MREVDAWIQRVDRPGWVWYAKILSGNDTLLNESHQAGPYIPRAVVEFLFPSLFRSGELNPRNTFHIRIDSHGTSTDATVIWYNNKVVSDGTRNECRITNWGGRDSPVLDPEATGSLCAFAFRRGEFGDVEECRVWRCESEDEVVALEDILGPVEPGHWVLHNPAGEPLFLGKAVEDLPCALSHEEIPPEWLMEFPRPDVIVSRAVDSLPSVSRAPADERLVRRRDCEYAIFRSIEHAYVLPRIREGFATVDVFVDYANAITNRRKQRSGLSLELHAKRIFEEDEVGHSYNEQTEQRKRPDFVFPSIERYHDQSWPVDRLLMLAAKTTCRERWRQVLEEADRIPAKHLLTLQEGVSLGQFEQMTQAGIVLVVPAGLHDVYRPEIRPHLKSLHEFTRLARQVSRK